LILRTFSQCSSRACLGKVIVLNYERKRGAALATLRLRERSRKLFTRDTH
jgi:hypothetical protein